MEKTSMANIAVVAAAGLALSFPVGAAQPPPGYPAKSDVLEAFNRHLPERHPYLLYGSGGAEAFRARASLQGSPVVSALRKGIVAGADGLMDKSPFQRKLVGRRMLTEAGSRCHLLAAAYLATKDVKYARRCIAEMDATAEYPDWNPSHFLDTATVALGVSIGYDACWNVMSDEERSRISAALADKCIAASANHWFWSTPCNWSHVCGCGVAAAALAIARDEGRLESSAEVVAACCRTARGGADAYAPCGVYPEGAAYWSYGTDRFVLLMDMLEKTCGGSFGLLEMPGVLQTGAFIDAITAPSGEYFDFSDRNMRADGFSRGIEWSMFWLGAKAGHEEWFSYENGRLNAPERMKASPGAWPIPCVLWWRESSSGRRSPEGARLFQHDSQPVGVVVDSSNWVAVKGGVASYSHGHMDAGSFVYETFGDGWAQRWVCDGGTEDYHSLESDGIDLWNMSQDSSRWDVYRYSERAHSVFTVDGAQPSVDALVTLSQVGETAFMADTSRLYPVCAASSKRTYSLTGGKLSVKDSFSGVSGLHTYRWAFPTRTAASVVKEGVLLKADCRQMLVTASRDGVWSVEDEPDDTGHGGGSFHRVVFTSELLDGEYAFTFAAVGGNEGRDGGGFWQWLVDLFK